MDCLIIIWPKFMVCCNKNEEKYDREKPYPYVNN